MKFILICILLDIGVGVGGWLWGFGIKLFLSMILIWRKMLLIFINNEVKYVIFILMIKLIMKKNELLKLFL